MHNLGNVWLAGGKESNRSAPVVEVKQNKECETADSTLSGGKIANHTSFINLCGCPGFQQPFKQLQPSAFPSFISDNKKDDSLLYSHRSSPSRSSHAGRG